MPRREPAVGPAAACRRPDVVWGRRYLLSVRCSVYDDAPCALRVSMNTKVERIISIPKTGRRSKPKARRIQHWPRSYFKLNNMELGSTDYSTPNDRRSDVQAFEHFAGEAAIAIGRARLGSVGEDRLRRRRGVGERTAHRDLGVEHGLAVLRAELVANFDSGFRRAVHGAEQDAEQPVTHAQTAAHRLQ